MKDFFYRDANVVRSGARQRRRKVLLALSRCCLDPADWMP